MFPFLIRDSVPEITRDIERVGKVKKNQNGLCHKLITMNTYANILENKNDYLIRCAAGGCFDLVKILLKEGAAIDHVNENGDTALICGRGYPQIVKLLIKKGAKINHSNVKGETALMLASNDDNLEVVNMLIMNGATD